MSRVLVVEDEQHLAEGLRFNLEAEGYQVELVDAGEAALEPRAHCRVKILQHVVTVPRATDIPHPSAGCAGLGYASAQ